MSSLDHAGLSGVDPLGAVTFVENHDTDLNSPIVRNKALAYAHILTSEGYPCVFYRDYSTDPHCFRIEPIIDRLIWIHEHLAQGPTQQRWKDPGVSAFERLGGARLLVALNKDPGVSRTIKLETGFPPHTELRDFAGHGPNLTTDGDSGLTLTIPKNDNGFGFVCYSRPAPLEPFVVHAVPVQQDYEGASDLDLKPAAEAAAVSVCRIFVEAHHPIEAELFYDTHDWSPSTAIRLELQDPGGKVVAHRNYDAATPQGAALQFDPQQKGFHTFFVQSANTPDQNKQPSYSLRVRYSAPQVL